MNQPPEHWRSLAHLEGAPHLKADQEMEFPNGAPTPEGFSRRDTLKLAGASLALSGLAGCDVLRRPEEHILPFTQMPEHVVPGVPQHYATVMSRPEGAVGLVAESNDGRPTKLEGNPLHPASLGGSDTWAQAEVLKLYDPDRGRAPLNKGAPSTWDAFDAFFKTQVEAFSGNGGQGLFVLAEENDAPTFERLLAAFRAKYPKAQVHRFDPLFPDHTLAGAELAYGPGARVRYDLEKANVIFALDCNFLTEGPEHLRLARQFGKRRQTLTKEDASKMNRLYVAEGVFSPTGANADHRVRVASGEAVELLKALGRELQKQGVSLGELSSALEGTAPAGTEKFAAVLAKDLAKHRGAVAIMVGERQPAPVHAMAHALNAALDGAFSVSTKPNASARTSHADSLAALVKSLNAGEVKTLFVFDANPLFTAPGAARFGAAMDKAETVVHVGVLPEETGLRATWHAPSTHFLESWTDARAWDGTASIGQPLILPLFGGRSPLSLLAGMSGQTETDDKKLVESTWRGSGQPLADTHGYRQALHDGVIAHTAYPTSSGSTAAKGRIAEALARVKPVRPAKDALELAVVTGHLLDGRLSNVGWMLELPESLSKLSWDNAALVSPALAKELGISSRVRKNSYASDLVELSVEDRKITLPTFVLPGLAPYTISIVGGFGKTAGGVAKGVGVDPFPLLGVDGKVVQGVKLRLTGAIMDLCSTQEHFSVPGDPFHEVTFAEMSGHKPSEGNLYKLGLGKRALLVAGTAAEYEKKGGKELVEKATIPEHHVAKPAELGRPVLAVQPTDDVVYEGQQWGMAIDLSRCIGCNACTIACQAENNIPVVGREQVLLGREMHWIRIDRYFSGGVDDPQAAHQPVACQHCENAPCEPVCPVNATVHSEEGINDMAYNRCIGTRYCQNNCPFKVRRFNYLDFTTSGVIQRNETDAARIKTLSLQRNPDVTVRYRGVMEKCTFCTQRVEEAKISAKRHGHDRRALPDGTVTPACAQACPTEAITFGNVNDPNSQVVKLKQSDRNYEMLQELNIRPRNTYLARLKNENEELS
jgi:molybdopterin-containing oxidoreductase family iron-sulfur binding subunit